jgi:hypothetical protein
MNAFQVSGATQLTYAFTRCNNTLQKLLPLTGVTCQMHVSQHHTTKFVIAGEVLWQPVSTYFSVIQLVMNNAMHGTRRNV